MKQIIQDLKKGNIQQEKREIEGRGRRNREQISEVREQKGINFRPLAFRLLSSDYLLFGWNSLFDYFYFKLSCKLKSPL